MNHTPNFNFKNTLKHLIASIEDSHKLEGKMVMNNYPASVQGKLPNLHRAVKISIFYLGNLKENVLKQESLLLLFCERQMSKTKLKKLQGRITAPNY